MTGRRDDEFHRLRTGYLRLRAALRDPLSGLFAVPLHFDEIRALLVDRNRAGVFWVCLGERRLIETVYGWEAYDRMVTGAARFLALSKGSLFPERTVVATAGVHADCFAVFFPIEPGEAELDGASLAALGQVVEEALEDHLVSSVGGALTPTGARVGAAFLTDNAFQRFERRVYKALEEARSAADRPRDTEQLAWLAELQRVLRDGDVRTVFQPVVDLNSGRTVGLEAYARGPEGSVFQLPRVMFSVGEEAGLGGELDRMCRRLALESLAGGEAPELLFLNTTAENLIDPDWSSRETLEALARAGLSPAQAVLEVPESQLLANPEAYRDAFAPLRRLGYRLSLDDVGSGPRSVALVEKLRPEFIKFDLTLVRGIAQDQLRRELVRSLVLLAERAGSQLVAERVETTDERQSLLACGARWGQGYLFAPETSRARPVSGLRDQGAQP